MTINLIQPAIEGQKVTSVWQRSSRFINCIFCDMRGRQVGDSPLCSNCLIDPVQTRTAIYMSMAGIEKREEQAGATWLAFAAEHADDWDRLCKARATLSAEDFARRAERHYATGNTYGKLLDAHAAYEQALAALGAERSRLERALEACDETL